METSADYYRKHQNAPFIETAKGNKFFIDAPVFDIEDIAHALGNQCRYTGHCRRFYSVAEHSLLVAMLMESNGWGDPFEGLLHDASEAYICDIAAPWKALLPDYKKLEGRVECALREYYRLPTTVTPGCKLADWVALLVEARHLMPSKGKEWLAPPEARLEANRMVERHINGYTPDIARDYFLAAFAEMGLPRGFTR